MIKMKENAQQAQELSEQLRLGTGGVHGTTPRHRKVIACCHRVNGPQ